MLSASHHGAKYTPSSKAAVRGVRLFQPQLGAKRDQLRKALSDLYCFGVKSACDRKPARIWHKGRGQRFDQKQIRALGCTVPS